MRLRPYIHTKDFNYIKNWASDERTHAMWCANLIPYPLSEEGMAQVLARDAEEWGGCAYVATQDDGRPIGFFCYSVNTESNSGFLKFVILDNTVRGKGYGTEMLKLAARYAFEITGVNSVRLNVYDINSAARKCYTKVGFTDEAMNTNSFAFGEEIWRSCRMVLAKESYIKSIL